MARPLPTAMVFLGAFDVAVMTQISRVNLTQAKSVRVSSFVATANTFEITTEESKIDQFVDFLRDLTMIGDT
jgi:hypothetical protein